MKTLTTAFAVRRSLVHLGLFVHLGLLATAPAAVAQPPSSTGFTLAQTTDGGAGATSASASFVVDGTLSQGSVVGAAASASFQVQSGFWTSASLGLELTVLGAGSGDGAVGGNGIACVATAGTTSGDCSATLPHGSALALVATPDPGQAFGGWSGCDSTSTTTEPGDTCTVQALSAEAVTATFVALGSIGNRVWRDVDGDGVQDPGEPGIDGVTVEIDGPSGPASTVTAGDGIYGFADLLPGTHTVSIDSSTLPAGLVPSFDPDGVATPHTADVFLEDGQARTDADFGYQPMADLGVSLVDSQDPLPGGQSLVYTVTVENFGPAPATDVAATGSLPGGTTLIGTSGCAEDPAAVPVCSLGNLAIGATASYTVDVSIDPSPPASITYSVSVSAMEADPVPGNDSASETTALDATPPRVVGVDTVPTTDDEALTDCESVHGLAIERLLLSFDEELADAGGAGGAVTDPASWLLVGAGPDGELATSGCAGGVAGDDVAIVPLAVGWSPGTATAAFELDGALAPGLYRLYACGTGGSVLTDLAGNPLDGDADGRSGDDFQRFFRADPDNRLANGHFDCDLSDWVLMSTNPSEIVHSSDDAGGSADSGSAAVENLTASTGLALGQCSAVTAEQEYALGADVRMSTSAAGIAVTLGCTFYSGADCLDDELGPASISTSYLGDTAGAWLHLADDVAVPLGAVSTICSVNFGSLNGTDFDARLDRVELRLAGEIFADGFESGDTTAWSGAVMP